MLLCLSYRNKFLKTNQLLLTMKNQTLYLNFNQPTKPGHFVIGNKKKKKQYLKAFKTRERSDATKYKPQ